MYRIVKGNCAELLPTWGPELFHCCITSPPYYGLRDYGIEPSEWPAIDYAPVPGAPPIHVPAMTCCLGLEPDATSFIGHMVHVFRGVWHVLRDDGTLWVNMGDSYADSGKGGGWPDKALGRNGLPSGRTAARDGLKPKDLMLIPARVALALQADGWYVRSDNIWSKPNPMPESVVDRPSRAHEYVYQFAKSERYFYDADAVREPHRDLRTFKSRHGVNKEGYKSATEKSVPNHRQTFPMTERVYNPLGRNRRTVWEIAAEPFPEAHFATFPTALVKPCLRAGTSEHGCCAACGAPWKRIVEVSGGTTGKSFHDHEGRTARGHRGGSEAARGWETYRRVTTGWEPTCPCGAGSPVVPCRVLDPFSGAATTGVVSVEEGREYVGTEISAVYISMSFRRLDAAATQRSMLFEAAAPTAPPAAPVPSQLALLPEGGP